MGEIWVQGILGRVSRCERSWVREIFAAGVAEFARADPVLGNRHLCAELGPGAQVAKLGVGDGGQQHLLVPEGDLGGDTLKVPGRKEAGEVAGPEALE